MGCLFNVVGYGISYKPHKLCLILFVLPCQQGGIIRKAAPHTVFHVPRLMLCSQFPAHFANTSKPIISIELSIFEDTPSGQESGKAIAAPMGNSPSQVCY